MKLLVGGGTDLGSDIRTLFSLLFYFLKGEGIKSNVDTHFREKQVNITNLFYC